MLALENLPVVVLRCSALPVTGEGPHASFSQPSTQARAPPIPCLLQGSVAAAVLRVPQAPPISLFLSWSTTISIQTSCSILGPQVTLQPLPHFPAPFTAELLKGEVYTAGSYLPSPAVTTPTPIILLYLLIPAHNLPISLTNIWAP